MATELAFCIMSDLHFGRDLLGKLDSPVLGVPGFVELMRADRAVEWFFLHFCKTADEGRLMSLSHYVTKLRRRLKSESHPSSEAEPLGEFDLYILLGDLVTFADVQSYHFLKRYLTTEKQFSKRCKGLGIDRDRLLAIPGNHDKLLRASLTEYNLSFATDVGLPEMGTQDCTIITKSFPHCGRECLFVLVDANKYCAQDLKLDDTFPQHLACGTISKTLLANVKNKLEKLRDGESVGNVKLEHGFDSAIKIALVHFAVNRSRFPLTLLPHDCPGIEDLADALGSFEVKLLLHGHFHRPDLYAHTNGATVVSIPSTSQIGGQNGLFLLKLLDNGEMRTEYHSWKNGTFVPDGRRFLSRPIDIPPSWRVKPAA